MYDDVTLTVLSALRSFQGAGLLGMVARSLRVSPPPPHSESVVALLVRLCTAVAYAPHGVIAEHDRADVLRRLRARLLQVPARVYSPDDIAPPIRAFITIIIRGAIASLQPRARNSPSLLTTWPLFNFSFFFSNPPPPVPSRAYITENIAPLIWAL